MDKNKDAQLTYEEFVEGSKQDPTIVQVSRPSITDDAVFPSTLHFRRCRCMMAWFS
jgi:hypothetical protein